MSYKAIITNSKIKPYVACIDIHDEKGNFVDGYYVTELEDKRQIEPKETTEEECQFCKRFDEITAVCFDYPELSFEDARKKCAVHDRDVAHGCA